MKRIFFFSIKAVKWIFIAFLVFAASLFFRDQTIPRPLLERMVADLPAVVKCERARFGFRHGLTLENLRAYTGGASLEPMVSARSATIDIFARKVVVEGLKYQRLPESYYKPGWSEKNEPLAVELPDIGEFDIVLADCDILGLRPRRVQARASVRPKSMSAESVLIDWPERGKMLVICGMCTVDFGSQTLHAEVSGSAYPSQIRPLLVALDVPVALPYMDAFTEIEKPVPASGRFDVNLVNNDFRMSLDLKPDLGCYNDVKMSYAEGTLDLYAYVRGTNSNARFSVTLDKALDRNGRDLSGKISILSERDLVRLDYDVASRLLFEDILAIADFLKPSDLPALKFFSAPQVTVKGTSGVSAADSGANDLAFSVSAADMSFLDFAMKNVKADFVLRGEDLVFKRISATGKDGGVLEGTAKASFPGMEADRASFTTAFTYDNGTLEEMSDFFKFDLGERHGSVSGVFEFSGPVQTNAVRRLDGRGSVKIKDGQLAQMKLFAGLTDALAKRVPGIGFIVNQTDASCDFTVTNGVFATENLYIEGGLVSLKARGTYDIVSDNLDFIVRVRFSKNESLASKLIHPVTWPFTKLLLEFKATGSIDSPDWEYLSIIDKVL